MRFVVLNFQNSEKLRPSGSGQYKDYGSISDLSSSLIGESLLDANSEKEQVITSLQDILFCDILWMILL